MYSEDLRRSVLNQYVEGEEGLRVVAERTGVAVNTIQNWRERLYETGDVKSKPHPGRTGKLDEAGHAHVARFLREDPDATDTELVARLAPRGYSVSVSTVRRSLAKQSITRKKRVPSRQKATGPTS